MRAMLLSYGLFFAALNAAQAQEATFYGRNESASMPRPGAFIPAGTSWECGAIDGRRCWDGNAWHELFPAEPHHYARKLPSRVSCRAIMNVTHDCWDGLGWYRLPQGSVFGIVAPVSAPDAGAFRTTPRCALALCDLG